MNGFNMVLGSLYKEKTVTLYESQTYQILVNGLRFNIFSAEQKPKKYL